MRREQHTPSLRFEHLLPLVLFAGLAIAAPSGCVPTDAPLNNTASDMDALDMGEVAKDMNAVDLDLDIPDLSEGERCEN